MIKRAAVYRGSYKQHAEGIRAICAGLLLLMAVAAWAEPATWDDVLVQTAGPADVTVSYGEHRDQFGELRWPPDAGPHPVVVVIHGGCWLPDFDLDHVRPLAEAITALGYVTWTIEYRRPAEDEDGWPETFMDAAAAVDHLRELADANDLDLDQITLLGHSAGGQLALWLAARPDFGADHPLFEVQALPVTRVLALAPITDMADYASEASGCPAGARRVLGGAPDERPKRYRAVSPVENLPRAVRVDLVHAVADPIVPLEQSERFVDLFKQAGGDIDLHRIPDPAGHFELVLTQGGGWEQVQDFLKRP